MVTGIHHITSIASTPKKNIEFYTKILHQRYVKQTVNFDDPSVFHLYYGNKTGSPGSALTFFVGWQIPPGLQGSGAMDFTYYTISDQNSKSWLEHLQKYKIEYQLSTSVDEKEVIEFTDYDGTPMALIVDKDLPTNLSLDIDPKDSELMFTGARLNVESSKNITPVLEKVFSMEKSEESRTTSRYVFKNSHQWIDVYESPDTMPARQGIGSVHHIAFRAKDQEHQVQIQDHLVSLGLQPTQVIDRKYFQSVYFRTPAGILFEIATDEPGFTVDESEDELGSRLQLPPWYEPHRKEIEAHLNTIS